ncbi:MAG: hypothetical protein ACI845_002619 [Gammaproteobacteria bacterium]|jgi:hypothetical protein
MENRISSIFKLYPSDGLMKTTSVLYVMATSVIVFYHNQIMFSEGLILLLLLLLIREVDQYCKATTKLPLVVQVNENSDEIVINKNGNYQNYVKFNLYVNRWFAILKVLNEKGGDQILITHDRFKYPMEYSDFRYLLLTLESRQHGN